jgi:hypothetical protein
MHFFKKKHFYVSTYKSQGSSKRSDMYSSNLSSGRFVARPSQASASPRTTIAYRLQQPQEIKHASSFQTEALFLQATREGWKGAVPPLSSQVIPFLLREWSGQSSYTPGRHIVFLVF